MKPSILRGSSAGRAMTVLVFALALAGCDNALNFNPVEPSFQPSTLDTMRTVEIIGSLTPQGDSFAEATILYDGREVLGARAECGETDRCAKLNLTGVARSAGGRHTISLQVLRQSPDTVDYLAEVTIQVSRGKLWPTQPVTLALKPTRATLRTGQIVTFEVDFRDTLT